MIHHLKPFAPLDFLIIALCLGGSFFFLPLFSSYQGASVAVFRDNDKIALYPLSAEKDMSVQGKLGPFVISIRNNTVCVVSSNCPRRICMHRGKIRNNGQQIVCAPNHILIELETSSRKAPDAVTQ
jgi:hypothetical protein